MFCTTICMRCLKGYNTTTRMLFVNTSLVFCIVCFGNTLHPGVAIKSLLPPFFFFWRVVPEKRVSSYSRGTQLTFVFVINQMRQSSSSRAINSTSCRMVVMPRSFSYCSFSSSFSLMLFTKKKPQAFVTVSCHGFCPLYSCHSSELSDAHMSRLTGKRPRASCTVSILTHARTHTHIQRLHTKTKCTFAFFC